MNHFYHQKKTKMRLSLMILNGLILKILKIKINVLVTHGYQLHSLMLYYFIQYLKEEETVLVLLDFVNEAQRLAIKVLREMQADDPRNGRKSVKEYYMMKIIMKVKC